jgi:hypothetical protein
MLSPHQKIRSDLIGDSPIWEISRLNAALAGEKVSLLGSLPNFGLSVTDPVFGLKTAI